MADNAATEEANASRRAAALSHLAERTAKVAAATGTRQVLTMGALAVTAAVVARCFGPRAFGEYAGGTAAFNLINGLTDLGFSVILLRELGALSDGEQAALIGTTVLAQCLWGLMLSGALAILALLASGERAAVMFVLAPALMLSGLAASRSIFGVRYIARPLLILDISTTLAQCLVAVVLAVNHVAVIWLAVNLSFWYATTYLLAIALARRQVAITPGDLRSVGRLLRRALPLGAASVLASLYFTIDMTLLGWLVKPQAVALYAIATRVLGMIVMVPGFVMAAGIPSLSRHAHNRDDLGTLTGTFASWLAVTALPLLLAVGIFSHTVVHLLFGSRYDAAGPVLRVLMVAALLSLVSNVSGVILLTKGIIRPQLVFNTLSLAVNIAGNLLLTPRFGVMAAAWLTVLSELIVVSYGVVVLRAHVSWRRVLAELWRPAGAVAVAVAAGLCVGRTSLESILAYSLAFCLALTCFGGWPEVVARGRLSWLRRSSAP